ncbi:iron-siderophore ABC transporter substrate-binding protein [Nocardioides panacisoli]|uniref:iron-siderophore ABC transporter substrate-binding protein n=1 Tax=Nocardioides panacisoli TaxID=627624 RepID=UPI001C63B342|nr:iron-siderophore ABC transporter substrate-binding protein [Nocardioides panacisoli]QYJ04191.1 iron-siderophore ABC transporter substrate-binding protein [Nocardioides panacisoli]
MPVSTARTYRRRATRVGTATILSTALLAFAACGSDSGGGDDTAADGGGEFSEVTLEHAFGETTISEEPTSVVTLGWGSSEAAMALGTIPSAIEIQEYGGNEEGVLPWVEEELTAQDADTPTLLPSTNAGDPAYEEILAETPDLILAPYSGITEEQYEKLAKIAPTVAYPEVPWSTPWRDVIRITGEALGKADQAEELVTEIDGDLAEQAEAHPEFEGVSIATLAGDTTQFYTYTPADPRAAFLEDLGFTTAPSVEEFAETGEEGAFFIGFSFEKADQLTSDVLLTYMDSEENQQTLEGSAPYQSMEQVQEGTVAQVVGQSYVSSVSPPNALSLQWGLPHLIEQLEGAVADLS